MKYHKKSVTPQGIFKGLDDIKEHTINFSMTVPEKQQLCSILAECLITEFLEVLIPVEEGEFYLDDNAFEPPTGTMDFQFS